MMEIRNLTDLEELVGTEKTNAIVTEAFMTMVEKARRFDEIEDTIANGKGLITIESNGLLDFCRSHNIQVIAQQPLAMGMLTGKYDIDSPATGSRRQMMLRYSVPRLDILLRTMNYIGLENNGKNPAQVALNWVMKKGIIPIPGVKTLSQAIENNLTPQWEMTEEQMNLLDTLTGKTEIQISDDEIS